MRILTLLVALSLAPAAFADDANKPSTDTTTSTDTPAKKAGKLSKDDLQVLAHYHALDHKEVDLGKTAIKRAQSEAVKDYGRMLVEEHGDSDNENLALAKQRGQQIPAAKPMTKIEKQEKAKSKKQVAQLKKLDGAAFDTAFIAAMIEDHEKELARIDTKVSQVEDAALADLIRSKKQILQKHADRARELQKDMTQTVSSAEAPPDDQGAQARRPNQ